MRKREAMQTTKQMAKHILAWMLSVLMILSAVDVSGWGITAASAQEASGNTENEIQAADPDEFKEAVKTVNENPEQEYTIRITKDFSGDIEDQVTINSGVTVNIEMEPEVNGMIDFKGGFENHGTVQFAGSKEGKFVIDGKSNDGTIKIEQSTVFVIDGRRNFESCFDNKGLLINYGCLQIVNFATLDNDKELINYGKIIVDSDEGTFSYLENCSGAKLMNYGYLDIGTNGNVESKGNTENMEQGIISNNCIFRSEYDGIITNYGRIENKDTVNIMDTSVWKNESTGIIENFGRISKDGEASLINSGIVRSEREIPDVERNAVRIKKTVSVTVGEHMKAVDGAEDTKQSVYTSEKMNRLIFTAEDGYCFSPDYVKNVKITENSGISVTRDNVRQITVSGTLADSFPSDVTVVLPAADKIEEIPENAPEDTIVSNTTQTVREAAEAILGKNSGWIFDEDTLAKTIEIGGSIKVTAEYIAADKDCYVTTTKEITITRADCEEDKTVLYTGEGEMAPTCTKEGIGHTECRFCHRVMNKNISVAANGHETTKVPAKEATEKETGNIEYYICSICQKYFSDEAGKNEITDKTSVVIPVKEVTPAEQPGTGSTENQEQPGTGSTENPEQPGTETTENTDQSKPAPKKKGTKFKDAAGNQYKVTGSDQKNPTVECVKPKSNAKGTVKIPASVRYDGVTYKVTSVADKAFRNNKKVTNITVGTNVKSIGRSAFEKCIKLKTVTIGKNVTKIGKNAFGSCKNLKTLTIKSAKLTKKGLASGSFKGITKKTVVKVPKGKVKAYKKLLQSKGLDKKVKVK